MLLSVGEAASVLGVSVSTMRRWEKEGKLEASSRTEGGHRRYQLSSLLKNNYESAVKRRVIGYCRVSSYDQKADLVRQVKRLEEHCTMRGCKYEIIQDMGSGLNFKKRGLRKLLRLIMTGQVEKLILTHKDRLLRFGSELIFELCSFFQTEVVVVEADSKISDNESLAQDVIELMTVFSARLYGKRSHQNRVRKLQDAI